MVGIESLLLALIAGPQLGRPLPKIPVQMPYMPGQREIVMGVQPYPETMMQIIYQNDAPPDFPSTGNGNIVPGGLIEKALGWVRWSSRPDQVFGKPCLALKLQGLLHESIRKQAFDVNMTRIWWVDADNKILRQYEAFQNPWHHGTANAFYKADSVDITVDDDEKGRKQTSLFPACGIDKLDDQFKPMMAGGTVLNREKEYYVLDPFGGGVVKYTVHVSGSVMVDCFHMKFKGKTYEIAGPDLTQNAGVSDEGDLISVILPGQKSIVMQSIPPGKLGKG